VILREVLHAHIPTLRPASSVRDAVDKMDIYQFPALVVVDEDRAPLGVVTEGDLCRAVVEQGGLMAIGNEEIARFMSPDPVCAAPEMEVSDALQMMLSQGLTVLPISEDSRLIGMLLRVDLMQAMLMDLTPPPTAPAGS
jgi:CBS domain-containing protein